MTPPDVPKPLDVFRTYEQRRLLVLDGIMAKGRSWNILLLEPGRMDLTIKPPIKLPSSSFKGMGFGSKSVIQLELAEVGPFTISLILFPHRIKEECKLTKKDKKDIREIVISCIKSGINSLDCHSMTIKDNLYNAADVITISRQSDWEAIGNHVQKVLEKITEIRTVKQLKELLGEKELKSEPMVNPLLGYTFCFLATLLGQDYEVKVDNIHGTWAEVDAFYSSLHLPNVDLISLHIARDFVTPDNLPYVDFFNVTYIAQQLPLGTDDYYYQQAGIPGAGNLTYNFKNQTSHITHLKVYSRWTQDMTLHPEKRFVIPGIAFDLAELSNHLIIKSLGGKQKNHNDYQRRLLSFQPCREINSIVSALECGPDQRLEIVWAGNPTAASFGQLLQYANKEVADWERDHKLHNPQHIFQRYDKKAVMEWLTYFTTPCCNSIHSTISALSNAFTRTSSFGKQKENTIFQYPRFAIVDKQQFSNLLVAETILSFLFRGNLTETGRLTSIQGKKHRYEWTQQFLTSFGLQKKSPAIGDSLTLSNVTFSNGSVTYSGDMTTVNSPAWMSKEITQLLTEVSKVLRNDNDELYQVIMVNWSHTFTDPTTQGQVQAASELFAKQHKCPPDCRVVVLSVHEMLETKLFRQPRMKPEKRCYETEVYNLICQIEKFKRIDNKAFGLKTELENYLSKGIFNAGAPLTLNFPGEYVICLPSVVSTTTVERCQILWGQVLRIMRRMSPESQLCNRDRDLVEGLINDILINYENYKSLSLADIFDLLDNVCNEQMLDEISGDDPIYQSILSRFVK